MIHYLLLFCLAIFPLHGQEPGDRLVLVSVAPYVTIVNDLTAGQVSVDLLVPSGFSTHTYEPTPKQILHGAKARLWFTIGELFEPRAIKALQAENPKLQVVDLRQGLHLMDEHDCHEHEHSHLDPHIWMSPRMMQVETSRIAVSLSETFPELAELIRKNYPKIMSRLEELDRSIREILKNKKGKSIFVSHPAYGYFCNEYGLKQMSVEFEGKDPTPKQLFEVIQLAKKEQIHTIFTQKQYSTKASMLVAHEIDAKIIPLDPYSPHYFDSMLQIAQNFAEA
jgi:zinc transport system substrate-binding protein